MRYKQDPSPLSNYWHMVHRCTDPKHIKYEYYGKRGITVCDEWLNDRNTFLQWAENNGWSEGLTIDRLDNNKGYFPENCRWVAPELQSRNRRKPKTNKTGYIGVFKERGRYAAQVKTNGKKHYLGAFDTAVDAAIVRDNFIISNGLGHTLNNVLEVSDA